MNAIDSNAIGKINSFLSTFAERPLEHEGHTQKSLGQIALTAFNGDWDAATEEERTKWENAALHLLEKWREQITQPFSLNSTYPWGFYLYTPFFLSGEKDVDWEDVHGDTRQTYNNAARKVLCAVLVRNITLQGRRINFDTSPPSLGEIAFNSRFTQSRFADKGKKVQAKWEGGAQYLLYVWHQRIIAAFPPFKEFSWGAHLYVGVLSSRDNGYGIWRHESSELQQSYDIAATSTVKAMLNRAIMLQQEQIAGIASPMSLYPAV